MAEPIDRIPQHKHCVYCGKAYVNGVNRYCSEECKQQKKEELGKSKKKLLIIWVVAVVIMVVAIALSWNA